MTKREVNPFDNTPITAVDLDMARSDIGVWSFGLLALAALLVSMPATYDIMARYHTLTEIGAIQAVASLIVFELGAIISKLATLLFPQWRGRLISLQVALLLFVAGANALATTAAAPTGEQVQAFLFAGMLPFFQFVFLALCVARVKAMHLARLEAEAQHEPTQAERLAKALAEAQERAFKAMLGQLEQQMTVTTLAPAMLPAPAARIGFAATTQHKAIEKDEASQSHAEPMTQQQATEEAYQCPGCGASLETRGQWLTAKRWKKCDHCKS